MVGAGVAGLSVALGLRRAYVVSATERGSTWWAQGGIAAALAVDDSPREHAADTVAVSGGLAVGDAVDALTSGGRDAIERLVAIGAEFDRLASGELRLGREGGHRRSRVVSADGDATGVEVMRALNAAVEADDTVTSIAGTALDLARSGDRVVGVVVASPEGRHVFVAPAVILATGGAAHLFSHTTNPPSATGSGIVIAGRAGARLADLEFVQFHPTALLVGLDPMPLVTEALRGAGAILVDPEGRRFMEGIHRMAELAPRDVVARAIYWEYENGSRVYLDAREVPDIGSRYPTVTAQAASAGLDPAADLLPVAPAAHYFMGGVDADADGRTSMPGLWAVGECSSTGVHGANRLASNSLLEGLVFGARVAVDVDESLLDPPTGAVEVPAAAFELPVAAGSEIGLLRRVLWESAGVVRTAGGLRAGLSDIEDLAGSLCASIAGRGAGWLARYICMAALARRESRGGHFREDFPRADPGQQRRAIFEPDPAPPVERIV